MIGKTLSHYKILDELGRGGMGIVYKAEDTKLDRIVAIKVLPSAALSSEDDRARFYREAKAAAQLHHPHIASVFEIDEAVPEGANSDDLRPFIAMEFIDGKTLDEMVKSGPLKLKDAIRIGSEIADALKTAHEKNIVHRDVKSANVMLDASGRAKVLDFGLAKTAQSTKLTRMGSTVGTMAYMSPEQARGEEVDLRTDIWALGAVLYEMVAGRHPFPGDYEQAVVYSILNEDPEALTSVRTGVPMSLERLVDKCLAKSADRRYQSLSDALVDLQAVGDDLKEAKPAMSRTGVSIAVPVVAEKKPERLSTKMIGMGFVAGVILGALLMWLLKPNSSSPGSIQETAGVMRLELSLPENLPLAFIGAAPNSVGARSLDISSDGTKLVYVAQTEAGYELVLHEMDGSSFEILPGTVGAYGPSFSPDDSWVGFFADSELKKIRVDGGSPIPIAAVSDPVGFVWSPDGFMYFGDQQSIYIRRVFENGGDVETLVIGCCTVFPDYLGSESIFVRDYRLQQVQIYSAGTNSFRELPFDGSTLVHAATGHLVYSNGGRLFAVPYDQASYNVTGGSIPVIEDLRTESITMSGQFALVPNGTLVYASGLSNDLAELVWKNPDGSDTELDFPVAAYGAVKISPDGSRIAIVETTISGKEINVIDLRTGVKKSFAQGGVNWNPAWSNDGRRVLYRSFSGEDHIILSKDPDGSAPPDTLLRSDYGITAYEYSPDNKWLAVSESDSLSTDILWAVDTSNYADRIQISPSGEYSWGSRFSPDGSHIAYTQVSTGRSEIIVEPFPPTGQRWPISSTGGEEPIWLANGTELIFRDGNQWKVVSYTTEPQFFPSSPRVLFEGPYINVSGYEYDVGADGRILLLRPISEALTTTKLNVVVNWFEDLERLAPTTVN